MWTVTATMAAVTELGDHLRCQGIEVVTVESTSDYWRVWYVVLEAAGLKVQLVNARAVKNVPGRAKTDKKDAVWLAKLTERGMLQPSFVPPYDIRRLRDYTRLRADLVHDRARQWQRLEKLLERALIKVSSVASTLDTQSVRAMLEALIAGERNPKALADMAIGKMRAKRKELAEALNGKFEDHHAELARMILDQIDALTRQVDQLSARASELIAAIPAAWGIDADGATGPDAGKGPAAAVLPAVARLDEITGCGIIAAHAIIAEIGLDMSAFGTPGRLVPWAKRCPQTRQSGEKNTAGSPGKGAPWLNGPLAEIAASPSAAGNGKPRQPSPAPSWSSSTACSPTRRRRGLETVAVAVGGRERRSGLGVVQVKIQAINRRHDLVADPGPLQLGFHMRQAVRGAGKIDGIRTH